MSQGLHRLVTQPAPKLPSSSAALGRRNAEVPTVRVRRGAWVPEHTGTGVGRGAAEPTLSVPLSAPAIPGKDLFLDGPRWEQTRGQLQLTTRAAGAEHRRPQGAAVLPPEEVTRGEVPAALPEVGTHGGRGRERCGAGGTGASDCQGRSRPRPRTRFFSSRETGADAHPRLRKTWVSALPTTAGTGPSKQRTRDGGYCSDTRRGPAGPAWLRRHGEHGGSACVSRSRDVRNW